MVFNKCIKVLRKWRPTRSVLLESKQIPGEALLFESGTLAILNSSEVDLIRKDYPDIDSAYALLGVLQIGQKLSYVVLVTGCQQVGKISDGSEVYKITNTLLVPLHATPCQHEGVVAVGKLLASGQFYFSVNNEEGSSFNLLTRAQVQGQEQPQFCWNRSLYVFLQRFGVNCKKWVVPLMCGSVLIQTVYAGDKQVKACLISRVSCERAGTRFNVRGLNDDGNVANFVESEQVLYVDKSVSSFVQVRGLVPVFWDQPGIQTGVNRIRLSRGFNCSHPAFTRHFEKLLSQYGGPSLCVDLLGDRDMEPLLSESYIEHLKSLDIPGAAEYVHFDYHQHCRPGHTEALESILLPQCSTFLDTYGHYTNVDGNIVCAQSGILRINCLDCLDRSNNSKAMFGSTMLLKQLESLGLSTKSTVVTRFKQLYEQFWKQNGDNISKLYAGTRALGDASKVAKLRNSARSVQRTIVNNFMDSGKQEAIDLLLLNGYVGSIGMKTRTLLAPSDLLSPYPLRKELTKRWLEYAQKEKLRVCIGSWNVNGGKHMRSIALKNHSMNDWLLDAPLIAGKGDRSPDNYTVPVDIYAIGFQELVGLTASNLVSTSSSNRYAWGAELQRVLSRDHQYALLTAEQLVGVCLYVFVRPHLIPFIKDVGVSAVKTGIGGKAGNKGGVAIRLLVHSTSLCFVCSHFAAHQTKVIERNQDFAEIYRKIQFPMNQPIEDHDYVFWCGDLNYRIELPSSLAKDVISKQEWNKLVRHDQLTKQRKLGKVFQGFAEGELNFAPTYKYDEFSDDYDTSEKCRVPAWCDRILWKRKSFLAPVKDQRGIAILRDDNGVFDTSGSYGWHPSSVTKVYERELTSDDPSLSWWHPGSLLHYGRAELKTSDHRPVVALFEVDIFHVNEQKREEIRSEVLESMGPADPTVIVKPVGVEFNSLNTTPLVKALHQYGDVVLVRVTDEATLVTFLRSQSALLALSFSGQEVEGIEVEVKLKEANYISNSRNVQLLTSEQLSPCLDVAEYIPEELFFAADEDSIEDNEIVQAQSLEPQSIQQDETRSLSDASLQSLESSDSLNFDSPPTQHNSQQLSFTSSEEEQTVPLQDSNEPRPKPARPPRPPPARPERPPPPTKSKIKPDCPPLLPERPPLPPERPQERPTIPKRPSLPSTDHLPLTTKSRSYTEGATPLTDLPTRPNRPPIPNRPPPPYMSLYQTK